MRDVTKARTSVAADYETNDRRTRRIVNTNHPSTDLQTPTVSQCKSKTVALNRWRGQSETTIQ